MVLVGALAAEQVKVFKARGGRLAEGVRAGHERRGGGGGGRGHAAVALYSGQM